MLGFVFHNCAIGDTGHPIVLRNFALSNNLHLRLPFRDERNKIR